MPADYVACRDKYIQKGLSPKVAKARCAAWFYKKHGYTVQEAHKKTKSTATEEKETVSIEATEYIAAISEDELADIDEDLVRLMLMDLEEIELAEATKEAHAKSDASAIDINLVDEMGVVELIATKVGAKAYTSDGVCVTWTKRALSKAHPTAKFTRASVNHLDGDYGRVIGSFMNKDNMHMVVKVDDYLKPWLATAGHLIGVSIEAVDVRINKKQEIIDAVFSGITFVFPPDHPACGNKDGCGILGTEDDGETQKETPSALHNTNEEEQTLIEGKEMADETDKTEGAQMPETQAETQAKEPEKKEDTICAKLHATKMAEKDAQIETLTKELEAVKATVAAFEAEKRTELLNTLKSEGVDPEPYKDEPKETVEKMVATIRAFKEAQDKAPIEDSGASVAATEQKTDESGEAASNPDGEDAKKDEVLEQTWEKAAKYGLKRPAK